MDPVRYGIRKHGNLKHKNRTRQRKQSTSFCFPQHKRTNTIHTHKPQQLGLARTVYIRCIYGIIGKEIAREIYGHIHRIYQVLASPNNIAPTSWLCASLLLKLTNTDENHQGNIRSYTPHISGSGQP